MYTSPGDGDCMMGKGHGRRRKQLCVEDAEKDSMHVDSTRWQGDGVAIKEASVRWIVRFGISVSPEKPLSIVTVFHPSACAMGVSKNRCKMLARQYGCQLARMLTFPISYLNNLNPQGCCFPLFPVWPNDFLLTACITFRHAHISWYVSSFAFVFSCNFHATGSRYNVNSGVLRGCITTFPLVPQINLVI